MEGFCVLPLDVYRGPGVKVTGAGWIDDGGFRGMVEEQHAADPTFAHEGTVAVAGLGAREAF
jgi:hypothetical protein